MTDVDLREVTLYRIADLENFRELRGSVPARENIIREYCMRVPRSLALVPIQGVWLMAIRKNFIREFARKFSKPAIR